MPILKRDEVIGVIFKVFLALLPVIGTPIATVYFINERAESHKAIETFRDDSTTFEQVTANYVRRVLDDEKPDRLATQQLTDNLRAQRRDLQNLTDHLPVADRRLTTEYSDGIDDLVATIPGVSNTLSMREFWEKTSKLLILRNSILGKLPS